MDAYTGLGRVYDMLMGDVDYDAWAAYYRALLDRAGVDVRRLCDLACGTGQFARRFARDGAQVVGIDMSEDMLRAAERSAREHGATVRYVRGDMRSFALPRPVDAVLCACDGINYLTQLSDVERCFARVAAGLRTGGAFAFDVSSRHKLENVLADQFYGETSEDVCVLWNNSYAQRVLTMDVTLFVREPAQRDVYRRCDEVHRQRAHDVDELAALLEACGFEGIEAFGDRTMEPPRPDEMRVHMIARKR